MKTLLSFLTAASMALPAYAGSAHVHGTAELNVVIDGKLLQLNFDSPLDNLVGFEHAARTDKEKQALQAMQAKLQKPEALFASSAAARCKAQPARITMPQTGDAKAAKAEQHAGLEAAFAFQCEAPEALKEIEVKLFDAFSGIKRIDAQVAAPRGQSAAKLTPRQRKLSW